MSASPVLEELTINTLSVSPPLRVVDKRHSPINLALQLGVLFWRVRLLVLDILLGFLDLDRNTFFGLDHRTVCALGNAGLVVDGVLHLGQVERWCGAGWGKAGPCGAVEGRSTTSLYAGEISRPRQNLLLVVCHSIETEVRYQQGT